MFFAARFCMPHELAPGYQRDPAFILIFARSGPTEPHTSQCNTQFLSARCQFLFFHALSDPLVAHLCGQSRQFSMFVLAGGTHSTAHSTLFLVA